MKAAVVRDGALPGPLLELVRAVEEGLPARGLVLVPADDPQVDLVVNASTLDEVRVNYLRPDPSVFVATLVDSDGAAWADEAQLKRATYAALVRSLSNLVVHRVHGGALGGRAFLMTPELGFRAQPAGAGLADAILDAVAPLAGARLVIANRLDEDLPPALHGGDATTRALAAAGRRLAALNLLPTVFDLDGVLTERDRRLVMKYFGLRQISYGNLSARRDARSFWMTGRGVDKGKLLRIGHDLLLVTGYDAASRTIVCSVPPGTDPAARVSVDAIEHFMIYRAVPAARAIVHVHAWLDGVPATQQSWPCGTQQLADEVAALVCAAPDPAAATVGLKNHGLTLVGRSLEEILARVEGRLTQEVPAL
ncbi:MAG: class II aldolase/adducin family protein [Acidobacteria bacterium]|nr:class II aldolase/adducin family protein [Acidobacteriota bacterium]